MITKITGLAARNAAFELSGRVTKDDYEKVILPEVKAAAEITDTINLLILINVNVSNRTLEPWMTNALLEVKNLITLHRVALVSDVPFLKEIVQMADKMLPGEYKAFTLMEEVPAKVWLGANEAGKSMAE